MKNSKTKPPGDEAAAATPPETASVVSLAPPATSDALAAGVEAARRIEESTDRIRRARAHAKRARSSDVRESTRRQLRRLLRALHGRQEAVLSQGIAPEEHHALVAHLHAVDLALDEFLATERLRKGTLKQIGKAAKTLRKAL